MKIFSIKKFKIEEVNLDEGKPVERILDSNGLAIKKYTTVKEAKSLAISYGLDIRVVNDEPLVLRLASAGLAEYEVKKAKKQVKLNSQPEPKVIQLGLYTANNDINRFVNQAKEFLLKGSDVIVSIRLRPKQLSLVQTGKLNIISFIQKIFPQKVSATEIEFQGNKVSYRISSKAYTSLLDRKEKIKTDKPAPSAEPQTQEESLRERFRAVVAEAAANRQQAAGISNHEIPNTVPIIYTRINTIIGALHSYRTEPAQERYFEMLNLILERMRDTFDSIDYNTSFRMILRLIRNQNNTTIHNFINWDSTEFNEDYTLRITPFIPFEITTEEEATNFLVNNFPNLVNIHNLDIRAFTNIYNAYYLINTGNLTLPHSSTIATPLNFVNQLKQSVAASYKNMVLRQALELYGQPGRAVEADCLMGLYGIIKHMYPNSQHFADSIANERVESRLHVYALEEVSDRYSDMLTALYV